MKHSNNSNKYINHIEKILKYREELHDYFLNLEKLNQVQKRANISLFFQKPLFCFFRYIFYLPVNLLNMIDKANNKFYLAKIENEIKVLKDEINNIKKSNE